MDALARVRSVAAGDGAHAVPDPQPAVTVVIVRDDPFGVLMMRRPMTMRFAAGVWVFPGGRVDAGEGDREAAVRETREETGLVLDPASLVPFDWWVTPEPETRRFDVRFFLAPEPAGQVPVRNAAEADELAWLDPAAALADGIAMLRPTMSVLEALAAAGSHAAALAATGTLVPRMPRPFDEGDRIAWHVVDAATGAVLERDVRMPRWEATPWQG